jgi:ATP-dependent metalloprotease FtsH
MNEKASQRASARKSWRQKHWSKQIMSNLAKQNDAIRFLLLNSLWNRRDNRRAFSLFIKDHRSSLLTAILGAMLFCLLLGIASQMSFPAANAVLTGENNVSYSSFVQQIRVHTVVAVIFRGDSAHALLRPTSQQEATSAAQNITELPGYVSWYRSVSSNTSLQGAYTAQTGRLTAIYTNVPGESKAFLVAILTSKNIHIDTLPALPPPTWLAIVSRLLPLLFLLVLLMVFLHLQRRRRHPLSNLGDRIKQMGKSRARRFEHAKEVVPVPQKSSKRSSTTMASTSVHGEAKVTARVSSIPDVNFRDVAGIDEVRTELQEIVYFLKDPERYRRLGARIPRGALLVGAPGTGKTLLAKAVAGEANVPFFCISASEFVEMFVGVGASRVRNLFSEAKQVAPAVVFIDEIDAVGRSRSMRINSNDEREQTLNQLLVEMDGFHSHEAIVVLAATNRVDILDKALLRPGRFDRHIVVSAPDQIGREAILRVHTRNTPLHADVDLTTLARLTTGMTGADLANLVNESALIAARENQESVTSRCFEDALARVQLGALRPIVMSDKERHVIAVHESGHALVAHYLPEADLVNRVTILPRGQSPGVTQFTAEADRYNYSREMLMTRIAVGLGGRVAEDLAFGYGRVTTGAENDFQTVTDIARRMVTRWGMSEKVGVMFAEAHTENTAALHFQRVDCAHTQALVLQEDGTTQVPSPPLSSSFFASMPMASRDTRGSMGAIIDAEVQCILHEAYTTARTLLGEHSEELSKVVDALMMHEQLDRNQFLALLG